MQRVFADPASDWATPGFAGILPAVRRLADAFGDRVVYTRFVAPDQPRGSWIAYYRQWPFALRPPDAPLWDIVDELPAAGRPVITSPSFGKWGHALDAATAGHDELVIVGVSTDCCVLATALAAADAGRAVTVVADACAGLSEQDHQRSLDAMSLFAPMIGISTESAVLAAP